MKIFILVFIILIFAFIFYVAIIRLFFPKKAERINEKYKRTIESRVADRINESSPFELRAITGRAVQLLESIDIIINTKKINVLNSRYHFALEVMSDLAANKNSKLYKNALVGAIERYREQYSKKVFNATHNYLLQNPEDIQFFNELYMEHLARCVSEYSQMHQDAIDEMVQPKAKIKRYEKIIKSIDSAVEYVEKLPPTEARDDLIRQMTVIIPKVQSEIEKLN